MENDRNAPVTKGDLEDSVVRLRTETKGDLEQLRSEMKGDLEDSVAQLRAEMHHQYDDLKETIRDTETKLLQAFYGFAESNRKRMGQQEADTAILTSRMATLEDRMMVVEKRLNIPPAQ